MSLAAETLALIRTIPGTFWGVLIGSFFSLTGVVLSNRANDRRLTEQLAHDMRMKARERDLNLRKDIYLEAAEAIAVGINALGGFANMEASNTQLTSAYLERTPAIAKVNVIATKETTEALATLTSELGASYLKLFAKRAPIMEIQARITILQQQIETFSRERDRMLELIKQFNIEGQSDARKWDVLQGNFQFEQDRIQQAVDEQQQLIASAQTAQTELFRDSANEVGQISRLVAPVLRSARAELGIPFDDKSYRDLVERNIEHQNDLINAFFEQLAADRNA